MQDIVHLGLWQLVFAYLFVLLLMGLVRWKRIPREKEIVIATVRMTLQLMLVGYVLAFVFEQGHWWYTAGAVLLMEAFAVRNIMKRVKVPLHRAIRRIIAFSMVSGTLVCILYFMLVVIRVTPWYDPRYFIPLAGMMIGNSMTGIALGVSKLVEGMHREKERVECALMLGATPKAACKSLRDRAFSDAILPTLNSMVGMGIVFLPGMMTGQILSGCRRLRQFSIRSPSCSASSAVYR